MKNQNENMAALFFYCRQRKNLSQRAFALLLRVNQSTICRIECGVIYPRGRTCKKLEAFMKESLSALIPIALKTKAILKKANRAADVYQKKGDQLSSKDLSASDLAYLKSKWYVMVKDMETALGRKSVRLKKATKRFWKEQLKQDFFHETLSADNSMLSFLKETRADNRLIQNQEERVKVLSAIMDSRGNRYMYTSSTELFLKNVALEEFFLIRKFRIEKLREVSKLVG